MHTMIWSRLQNLLKITLPVKKHAFTNCLKDDRETHLTLAASIQTKTTDAYEKAQDFNCRR